MLAERVRGSRFSATRYGARAVYFTLCLLALIRCTSVALAGNGETDAANGILFSIPSQPLGPALETYARTASREVLYDGALVVGRRSSSVEGVYTPEVALEILLAESGLWASFKDSEFFVLKMASIEQSISTGAGSQSAAQLRYYGRLQASLEAAFCGSSVLPNSARVAARLWVGQSGRVLQARPLSSTGNEERDLQIEKILRSLKMGAPPAAFEQPITIVIVPSAPGEGERCSAARTPPAMRAGP